MRRILILTITTLFLLLIFTACGQQDGVALPTRAALAELDISGVPAETGETAVDGTAPESAATGQEVEIESEGGLGETFSIGEDLGGAGTSMLSPEVANLFNNATFSLNTTLPADVTEAQIWQQPAVVLDVNRAKAIAQKWGFTGSLYTYAIPDQSSLGEEIAPEAAPLPVDLLEYHAFDGGKSIVITEGAAYFTDNSVPFDYENPRPFDQHAPAVESALQAMGLLDFPYTLEDGWGHEVWVNRVLDGLSTNYPEISAGVSEDGRLAFSSYQPLDQLTSAGSYPLISAETAWQQIQSGVDQDILFNFISQAEEPVISLDSALTGFQYWPREHQTGQEVHLYAFPTVFLPVDEGVNPVVQALNYTIQADDDTLRALAEQVGVNIHFWGILDENNNSLALTGWEPLPGLDPLIKNGTVQQQGEQLVLIDQTGSTFILPDAPPDLASGSLVNVFAWAARDAGQAYPVLDWEGIDMQLNQGSGETMALPDSPPPSAPDYSQISIDTVELAYYVNPEFQETANGRYQQSFLLLPVWQFTGTANNGDVLQFMVKATKQ